MVYLNKLMSNSSIEVICPFHDAQDYIVDLNKSIFYAKGCSFNEDCFYSHRDGSGKGGI